MSRIHRVTKAHATTWLGVRGEVWSYLSTSDPVGERVVALRWLEANPNVGNKAGDLILRHMSGDGRHAGAVIHDHRIIAKGAAADAAAYAEARLA